MSKDYYIYIVLSSTPYKVGKFIRIVTRKKYNHVSISFDANLHKLYSFSKYHENAPLYAGFTVESINRFEYNHKYSDIIIYKIPVTKKEYEEGNMLLNYMFEHKNRYVYNLFSAATTIFKKRILINNSYTCIEFAYEFLNRFDLLERSYRFFGFDNLDKELHRYIIYQGDVKNYITENDGWGEDNFRIKMKRKSYIGRTTLNVCRLIKRKIYN